MQDDDFASKLYCSLENQEWRYVMSDAPKPAFSCSFRYAGGLVADLRDKGEDYMDWYCTWANPDYQMAHVYPEVESALGELGWYPDPIDKARNNCEPEG